MGSKNQDPQKTHGFLHQGHPTPRDDFQPWKVPRYGAHVIFAIRNKEKAAKVPASGPKNPPWRDPVPLGLKKGSSGMVKTYRWKNPSFLSIFLVWGGVGWIIKTQQIFDFFPLIF